MKARLRTASLWSGLAVAMFVAGWLVSRAITRDGVDATPDQCRALGAAAMRNGACLEMWRAARKRFLGDEP